MQELDITSLACPLALLTLKRWLANTGKVAILTFKTGRDSEDILRFLKTQPYEITEHLLHQDHQQVTLKSNRNVNV